MLNFKKILLGDSNLDMREQSQWPELGTKMNHGTVTRRNIGNNSLQMIVNDRKHLEIRENHSQKNESGSSLLSCTSQRLSTRTCDFPELSDSFRKRKDKRNNKIRYVSNNNDCDQLTNLPQTCPEENISLKGEKKSLSKTPMSVDLNVMLKISVTLAEQRRQRKRMQQSRKRILPIQEQKSSSSCGNKLDSDCPFRHKGKKRLHKQHKHTTIKRAFLLAADKKSSKRKLTGSAYFTKRLKRLRQLILAGISSGQNIDELVTNLGRLGIVDNPSQSEQQPPIAQFSLSSVEVVKSVLHTKNFRPYCNHLITSNLKNKVNEFIVLLRTYQDKMYVRDPVACKAKRRYVCGCHETRKFLKANAVKLLLVANNLNVDNGIPTILEELFQMSNEFKVPLLFAGTSFDLGYWTLKKRKTSVIAILNYEGAEKLFNEVINELEIAKTNYQELVEKISLQLKNGIEGETSITDKEVILQEVEQQIRDNIISKLTL